MHLSLISVASVAGVIALLIVVAGIIGGSYRLSRNTAVVTSYRETAQAWEQKAAVQADQLATQAAQIRELELQRGECREQIKKLEGQVDLLSQWATGKATADALLAGQESIIAHIGAVQAEILGQIGDLRGMVKQRAAEA